MSFGLLHYIWTFLGEGTESILCKRRPVNFRLFFFLEMESYADDAICGAPCNKFVRDSSRKCGICSLYITESDPRLLQTEHLQIHVKHVVDCLVWSPHLQ